MGSEGTTLNLWRQNMTNSRIDVARRKFEALDGEIHFESTKNYRKDRFKSMN